jgi:transcriptional regulator with XRE-family HTH domain
VCTVTAKISSIAPTQTATAAATTTRGNGYRRRLGLRIQVQRTLKGMTQAELAEGADLSLKYVGEIERGEANASTEVVERIADVLHWDPLGSHDNGAVDTILEFGVPELRASVERIEMVMRLLEHTARRSIAPSTPSLQAEDRPSEDRRTGPRPSKRR